MGRKYTYICRDGINISCKLKQVMTETGRMPRNGFWKRQGESWILVVNGTQMGKDAKVIVHGSNTKTFAFPLSVIRVSEQAFEGIRDL